MVQYRGQILPLIHLSSRSPERRQEPRDVDSSEPEAENEKIQVVVYTDQGRSVGLVVDRILDITHEAVKIQKHAGRHGTLGSMVVQGRVTELLDLKGIIQTADPSFFNESGGLEEKGAQVDWENCQTQRRASPPREPMAGKKQFSTFVVDRLLFGVEVEKVQEVIRYQEMTRVPLAPSGGQRPHQPARADCDGR